MTGYNKKGLSGKGVATTIIMGLIATYFIVSLAPQLFSQLLNLNTTGITNLPVWVPTLLPIILAAGIVFMFIRLFMGKR